MQATGRYLREFDVALAAVRDAGRLLLAEFHRPGGPRGPRGKCPADNEAEQLIRDRLDEAFPSYGQRGEELRERDRLATDVDHHLWQIDPNDGTSVFQRGGRGASVSLALIRSGQPVLGIVFAYAARAGRGDLIAWSESHPLTRNDRPVAISAENQRSLSTGTVLVSHAADRRADANAAYCAPARFRAIPSIAYRLALVAAGEAVAGLSVSGPTDWDVAAGHALLIGAGDDLCVANGQWVRYNRNGLHRVGNCWGGERSIAAELSQRDFSSLLKNSQEDGAPYSLAKARADQLVDDPRLLDRAQACLLGQLAGDNLGALVEFESPEQIRGWYPQGPRELADGGCWNILAGQPTDDSELALMLARSILQTQRYDPESAASAYAWWLASGPFDVGHTTRTALTPGALALQRRGRVADAMRNAAAGSASQANGALMRVAPLAIYGHALPEEALAELARQDALLTHSHPVCQDANAVFCVAIAYALRTGADRRAIYEHARNWARARGLHADVLAAVDRAESGAPPYSRSSMGWVLLALQSAFFQLLHAPTLVDGLAETILMGGDTDTNAAIAGALLGAACGTDEIPPQWIDRLLTCRPLASLRTVRHPRPPAFWPVDCLVVAEQLASLGKVAAP